MDEKELIARLRRVEALLAGATTIGERSAADAAAERIRSRIREIETAEGPSNPAPHWSSRLLVAAMRRYCLQSRNEQALSSTIVVSVTPNGLLGEKLWAEFCKLSGPLQDQLHAVARGMIADALLAGPATAEVAPKAG